MTAVPSHTPEIHTQHTVHNAGHTHIQHTVHTHSTHTAHTHTEIKAKYVLMKWVRSIIMHVQKETLLSPHPLPLSSTPSPSTHITLHTFDILYPIFLTRLQLLKWQIGHVILQAVYQLWILSPYKHHKQSIKEGMDIVNHQFTFHLTLFWTIEFTGLLCASLTDHTHFISFISYTYSDRLEPAT